MSKLNWTTRLNVAHLAAELHHYRDQFIGLKVVRVGLKFRAAGV